MFEVYFQKGNISIGKGFKWPSEDCWKSEWRVNLWELGRTWEQKTRMWFERSPWLVASIKVLRYLHLCSEIFFFTWTIFKVFIQSVTVWLLLSMFWDFGPNACGFLAPRPAVETVPPALEGKFYPLDQQGSPQRCIHFDEAISSKGLWNNFYT